MNAGASMMNVVEVAYKFTFQGSDELPIRTPYPTISRTHVKETGIVNASHFLVSAR